MATKDFKVKNGLTVAESIRVDSGSIIVAGLEVINSSGGVVGVYQGFDSDFSSSILNTTTDSLSEGLNNLYYTTARVDSAFDARLATKTTNDVTEGSNLYYTTARVDSAFDIRLALKNTGDLSEGSNLYYTTARVDSAFDARLATKTTDDLTEGSNQYYTDTRVQTYLSNNSYATLSNIDSAIAALVDAAPSQLDTLNELAAAINDDSNFAATVNNQLSLKLNTADFSSTANTWILGKSTSDLSEGSNLYYTTTRVDSAFDDRLATKTTSDLAEGANLYYTTSRFDSAFSQKTTSDLSEGSNLYYTKSRADSDITFLINSSYIENLRPAEVIFEVSNNLSSSYSFLGDGFPVSSDNPDLYVQRGMTYKFKVSTTGHPFEIRTSDGGSAYSSGVTNNSIQSGDIIFTVPMDAPDTLYYQCTIHSGMGGTIYITEAASITTDTVSEGTTNLYYTDARVTALVDSAYVQARQVDLYRDSSFVTGIIDATYINSLVNATDSTAVISIVTDTIDSAYIQARQLIGGGSGTVDSAQTIALIIDTIDSAYIQARQLIGGGSGTVDSAQTIALITDTVDSAYIAERGGIYYLDTFGVSEYKFTADSNQTIFNGVDDNGNTLAFNSNNYQVFINGVKITSSDYSANSLTDTITLTDPASYQDEVLVTVYNREQGATTVTLVDSAWLSDFSGLDSSSVINLIDSAYIQARQLVGGGGGSGTVDSAQTIALITDIVDSDYIKGFVSLGLLTSEYYFQNYKFIADSNQIIFSGSDFNGNVLSFDSDDFQIYINGIRITDVDYTSDPSNNTITLSTGTLLNDEVIISTLNVRVGNISPIANIIDSAYINARVVIPQAYGDSDVFDIIDSAYISSRTNLSYAAGFGSITNYLFTADSGQTTFVGADNNGEILSYSPNAVQIYLNGVLLIGQEDYTANNGSSIILSEPADSGDQLTINEFASYFSALAKNMVYQGKTYFKTYSYIADSGQVVFSGSDVNSDILSFDSDNYQVYINGFKINSTDFTANPINNTINLTLPSNLNDEITISVVDNKSSDSEFQEILRTEINDYLPGAIDSYQSVFINIIDSSYINARIDRGGSWAELTSSRGITAGEKLILDTTSLSITVTLPATASLGDEIRIIDGTGNASINNITVNRNGHLIQGNDSDLIINIDRAAFGLVYYNATNGWLFTEV